MYCVIESPRLVPPMMTASASDIQRYRRGTTSPKQHLRSGTKYAPKQPPPKRGEKSSTCLRDNPPFNGPKNGVTNRPRENPIIAKIVSTLTHQRADDGQFGYVNKCRNQKHTRDVSFAHPSVRCTKSAMISFTSVLNESFSPQLEELLFFNPNQAVVSREIEATATLFGSPKIRRMDGRLFLDFNPPYSPSAFQSLFILDQSRRHKELIGTLIYHRAQNKLVLLFVAIDEEFTYDGSRSDECLLLNVVRQLIDIGRRIKGITEIEIELRGQQKAYIPLRRLNVRKE